MNRIVDTLAIDEIFVWIAVHSVEDEALNRRETLVTTAVA